MRDNINVRIKRLNKEFDLPKYSTDGSACVDLMANIHIPVLLERNVPQLIPVGIAIALPDGYEAQVRPRSGLALKNGVTVVNTPGTIDSDFRGEISVILINHRLVPFEITRGMRIAQLMVSPVPKIIWREVEDLDKTYRGEGGYGSTGL